MSNSLFVKNVEALAKRNRSLAAKVANFGDLSDFELVPATAGGMALKQAGAFLGAAEPLAEAKMQAGAVKVAPEQDYILLGLGLGYNLKLLEAISDSATKFVIIERDLRFIVIALSLVDISYLLDANRILFIGDYGPGDTALTFGGIAAYLALFSPYSLELPSAVALHPDYYAVVKEDVQRAIAAAQVGFRSSQELAVADIFNRFENMNAYMGAQLCFDDLPICAESGAVLVAAGPSLQKNIAALKECQLHICAVGTAARRLLAEGIVPDTIVTMDYHIASTKYLEEMTIPAGANWPTLIVDARSHSRAARIYDGPIAFLPDEKLFQICRGQKPRADQAFAPAATVAHQAFRFLERMGFATIILCGLDLGNPWGVTHIPGIATYDEWHSSLGRFSSYEMLEWEQILRFRSELLRSEDSDGNPVYSDSLMMTYLEAFNRAILACKARVIDATEGGARKKGAEIMSLAEALQTATATLALPPVIAEACDCDELQQRLLNNLRRGIVLAGELRRAIEHGVGMEIITALQRQLLQFPLLLELAEILEPDDSLRLKKVDRRIEAASEPALRMSLQGERDRFYLALIERGCERLLHKLEGLVAAGDEQKLTSDG